MAVAMVIMEAMADMVTVMFTVEEQAILMLKYLREANCL